MNNIIMLDDQNVIDYYLIGEKDVKYYLMNHYSCARKVNTWQQTRKISLKDVKDGLIFIPDFNYKIVGIYDYKNSKFIIDLGLFDNITPVNDRYLGTFSLGSSSNSEDFEVYINPVTKEEVSVSFAQFDAHYTCLLDNDGNIINSTILKDGQVPIKIDSLERFKREKTNELNKQKEMKKQEFYDWADSNNIFLKSKGYKL